MFGWGGSKVHSHYTTNRTQKRDHGGTSEEVGIDGRKGSRCLLSLTNRLRPLTKGGAKGTNVNVEGRSPKPDYSWRWEKKENSRGRTKHLARGRKAILIGQHLAEACRRNKCEEGEKSIPLQGKTGGRQRRQGKSPYRFHLALEQNRRGEGQPKVISTVMNLEPWGERGNAPPIDLLTAQKWGKTEKKIKSISLILKKHQDFRLFTF